MESMETTVQDKESGGRYDINYIPELTDYVQEYISFSQNEKFLGAAVAPNCGWTMAGIVAETAGIPLRLYSKTSYTNNVMECYDTFLPGAVTLGDILLEEGYKNYYIQGCEKSFGGKELYLIQHGEYQIYDIDEAKRRGKIPENYVAGWGYEEQYFNVYRCASRQAYEFIKWVKKQDFYENTTIVLAGEHCSMDAEFF